MIDIHCHILPGVDDGSKSLATTLNMCRIASNDGISKLVASPHNLNGVYRNERMDVLDHIKELELFLREHSINLSIISGSETYLDADLIKELNKGTLTTVNDLGKFLLVELPGFFDIDRVKEQFFELKIKGVTPIISHPERNRVIAGDVNVLGELIKSGALTQLTASSIVGDFGDEIKKISDRMLRQRMIHFVASDAHNDSSRAPILSKARKGVHQIVGEGECEGIFMKNPEGMINGVMPEIPEPLAYRKQFFSQMISFFK